MIRPLRRRHLETVAGLAILVPALYLAAIQARPPATMSEPFDPELAPAGLDSDAEGASTQEWSALPIRSRLLAAGGDRWIEVAATDELPHPDVLVYWSAVEPASDAPLTDARLLGALAGDQRRSYLLPREAGAGVGHLILYCLGHGELLGSHSLAAEGAVPVE